MSVLPESQITEACICNAPAPDSFRITNTNTSTGSIALAWHPAWLGASHTLEVLEMNNSGGWIPKDTIYNILGTSYTVTNLVYGTKYRFKIATNCTNGEPSEKKAIIDGIVLIIELVINGRTPLSPVSVATCTTIDYSAHNWVGFKVSTNGEIPNPTNSNYFEFGTRTEEDQAIPLIKRVIHDSKIVAGNFIHRYPMIPTPLIVQIIGSTDFKVFYIQGTKFKDIGVVRLNFDENTHSIQFCKSLWDDDYDLSVMIANLAGFSSPEHDERNNYTTQIGKFTAQNPFNNFINIFSPQINVDQVGGNIQLFNVHGQIVLEQDFDVFPDQLSIPTEMVSTGFYILRIETGSRVQILKINKSGI